MKLILLHATVSWYIYIYIFVYKCITPEIDVLAIGPSMMCPYTSEQLRISGKITPFGISKNLKKKKK